jgi:DNA-binding NarL/FixJ family response regulator
MGEQRVRVMVGEGQTTRKGLLRFVLENEGYDVVAEATSTLELAQRLVIHRPDVVVVDDGIDASAVGMMREVLPSAKVILVWPRGVTAVGADARLEPSEVMTSLGSTVGRLMGRGPVIAPPKPRFSPPDVIVVPEPESEEPEEPAVPEEPAMADAPGAPATPDLPEIDAPPAHVVEEATVVERLVEEPTPLPSTRTTATSEPLSNLLLRPADLASPAWTYAAAGATAVPADHRRRRVAVIVLAVVAGLLAIALFAALLNNTGPVPTRIVAGSVGDYQLPGSGGADITTDQPGTYEGIIHVRADGSIHLRASGDIRLRIDGLSHIVAVGDVKVTGDGVVNNVSAAKVRVRGNGTIRVTVRGGSIRLRLQGTVTAQGEGTVRIGGEGRFLITYRPA